MSGMNVDNSAANKHNVVFDLLSIKKTVPLQTRVVNMMGVKWPHRCGHHCLTQAT